MRPHLDGIAQEVDAVSGHRSRGLAIRASGSSAPLNGYCESNACLLNKGIHDLSIVKREMSVQTRAKKNRHEDEHSNPLTAILSNCPVRRPQTDLMDHDSLHDVQLLTAGIAVFK